MKTLAETTALAKARDLKDAHRRQVRERYEPRAKDCLTCETKGVCCLDAHFVNVRVSRLESLLMAEELRRLPKERLDAVVRRIGDTVARFGLDGETPESTYACPLFESSVGCIVHEVKPLPCVHHACYERPEDLPPDSLLDDAEEALDELTRRTYGRTLPADPIPVALLKLLEID